MRHLGSRCQNTLFRLGVSCRNLLECLLTIVYHDKSLRETQWEGGGSLSDATPHGDHRASLQYPVQHYHQSSAISRFYNLNNETTGSLSGNIEPPASSVPGDEPQYAITSANFDFQP